MPNVLVKDEKYERSYVAFASFADDTVISSGKDVKTVIEEAKKSGISEPVIVFVPNKNMTFVY